MKKCVFCGREHAAWRGGFSVGSICPECWAKLYIAERRVRRKAALCR